MRSKDHQILSFRLALSPFSGQVYRMETNAKFRVGDKVKNNFGRVLTVIAIEPLQIFVLEECGRWYHPTKLHPVVPDLSSIQI